MLGNSGLIGTSVLHAHDGLVMAEVGPVCVALWRERATPERFKIQKHHFDQVVRARAPDAALLVIVEAGSEPPEEPERKASSQMISAHAANLKCAAGVIEGAGFRAAITRSVLSGIVFLIRSPTPIKYFDSPSSAAPWLATYVKVGPVSLFIRQVEELRKLIPPR